VDWFGSTDDTLSEVKTKPLSLKARAREQWSRRYNLTFARKVNTLGCTVVLCIV